MDDPSAVFAQIVGAEIMRVGEWNGVAISHRDIADMAAAAEQIGFIPPLKIGHDDSIGARAWGWVKSLRVIGDRLVGDILDIPESLADVIREKGYDQLSAEIYKNFRRDGKVYRWVLGAVAVLGAEIPAVSGLRPISEIIMSDAESDAVLFVHRVGGSSMSEKDASALQAEIDALREEHHAALAKSQELIAMAASQKAEAEKQATEIASLRAAAEQLQAKNREAELALRMSAYKGPPAYRSILEVLYGVAPMVPDKIKFSFDGNERDVSLDMVVDHLANKLATDSQWMKARLSVAGGKDYSADPGAEVAERIGKMMASSPKMDYKDAMSAVLSADPDLKQAYAGV